jgi:hypothetical protein
MFITSRNYADEVQTIIDNSCDLSIAVAFWGCTAEQIFSNCRNKSIRIVCNLTMGGTNPDPIIKLRATKNIEIRQFNELHAKVIAGKTIALIGSANFSTNGLNLECEEGNGWEEAGLITKDTIEINKIQAWFNELWNKSKSITDNDIETAEKIWKSRRKHRKQKGSGGPLLDCPLTDLKDRPIYLAIWRVNASESADVEFESIKESVSQAETAPSLDQLDFFEDWGELPEDASLISVYYGPKGKIEVEYSCRRIPGLDRDFQNKETNEQSSLQIVIKEKSVCNMSFGPQEMGDLQNRLKPVIKELWSNRPEGDDATIVSLYDFLHKESELKVV